MIQDSFRLIFKRQTRRLRDEDITQATFFYTENDFKPYYRQHILPKVKTYEEDRINALRTFRTRLFISLPLWLSCILLVIYFGAYKTTHLDIELIIICTLFPTIGFVWWTLKSIADYKNNVKDNIYPLIFGFFGDDFHYSRESPVNVASLKPSQIIPSYDDEYPADYVRGTYKGVAIELFEATLKETRGSGKNRRRVTVFKGLFVMLEAPKKFKGKTIIRRDYGFMNWLVNAGQRRERVKLEDPVFEKQFEVFADNQVEARYLLTTSFMDRLLKLPKIFGSKGIQGSFYDTRLLLMIPTEKNYFKSSSIFKPATFIEEINAVLAEMKTLFEIVDILKFHEKTGV